MAITNKAFKEALVAQLDVCVKVSLDRPKEACIAAGCLGNLHDIARRLRPKRFSAPLLKRIEREAEKARKACLKNNAKGAS